MLDEVTRDELLEAPPEREQRVTALELFFDLVFVFAITQVTAFLYHDPTWLRLLEAFAILMVPVATEFATQLPAERVQAVRSPSWTTTRNQLRNNAAQEGRPEPPLGRSSERRLYDRCGREAAPRDE
jgi:hypothetical protein